MSCHISVFLWSIIPTYIVGLLLLNLVIIHIQKDSSIFLFTKEPPGREGL